MSEKEEKSKDYTEKEIVDNIQLATIELKTKYIAVMEEMKQLKQIAESVGYEIDFNKALVKKKTIVQLLK